MDKYAIALLDISIEVHTMLLLTDLSIHEIFVSYSPRFFLLSPAKLREYRFSLLGNNSCYTMQVYNSVCCNIQSLNKFDAQLQVSSQRLDKKFSAMSIILPSLF
jgi:hypothetical protein